MKITVCELPDEAARRDVAWADLVRHLRASPTDIVVLPEMPFCDWKTFTTRTVDPAAWRAALASHVLSAFRRRGVGRHLVAAVIDSARGRFDRVRLRTENSGATRFYEALGFRPSGAAADYTHVMELASERAPGSRAMLGA